MKDILWKIKLRLSSMSSKCGKYPIYLNKENEFLEAICHVCVAHELSLI